MAGGPLDLWNEWATQILVLLSFSLQVVLHVFAKVRRRKASSIMQRLLLWLAYQLSDSTATYAAGQLFFSSTPQDHLLVAFWAPFLLLHLGGPDNITAYSLEDSKLWKRHFLSLVVQVLGAGYILYKHIVGSGVLLMLAAILMSLVSVAKYVERTWALWCANFSSLQSSLKTMARDKHHQHFYTEHQDDLEDVDGELLLQRAHSLFHICQRGIVDSVIEVDYSDATIIRGLMEDRERMWTMMEMELSLIYDILYTKASVIQSWPGYCIRVISPLAVVASLVLFQLRGNDGASRVDVAVTYTLLCGALVVETKSLLGALRLELGFYLLVCHTMGLAPACSSLHWKMATASPLACFSSPFQAWQDGHDRKLEEVVRHHGTAQHAAISHRAGGSDESPAREFVQDAGTR